MRRSRKKFSIYSASPGLENTEKYGTRKYSSKKKKELEKLYSEFTKLHNKTKLKKNGTVTIKGKKRTWTLRNKPVTIKGKKRTWTLRNKAKSK